MCVCACVCLPANRSSGSSSNSESCLGPFELVLMSSAGRLAGSDCTHKPTHTHTHTHVTACVADQTMSGYDKSLEKNLFLPFKDSMSAEHVRVSRKPRFSESRHFHLTPSETKLQIFTITEVSQLFGSIQLPKI